nr:MAG TPA: hypothetical protein [Crassvirales sp.]
MIFIKITKIWIYIKIKIIYILLNYWNSSFFCLLFNNRT